MKTILNRLTDWEHWPFLLFYFPISYAWLWSYIKSGSFWFFTASNPTLTFGGLEGESKSEMYKQLPAHLCPRSIYITPSAPFADVVQQVRMQRMEYPFVVKPDVGMKGILFRKIENEAQLEKYHRHMPVDYIIQQFLDLPHEVSVFYYRKPGTSKGRITALIQKDLLEVTGDGTSALSELLKRHPGVEGLLPKIMKQQGKHLEGVLGNGEKFCLSHIANLVNGAKFKNLYDKVDDKLVGVFDDISHNNQFYYGRYDIKCFSVNDLKEGKNFYILEFNGAGSVPNHIYTGTYTLMQAYKEILMHWRLLLEASEINNKKGHRYWSFIKGHCFFKNSKKHFNMLKKLDKELFLN